VVKKDGLTADKGLQAADPGHVRFDPAKRCNYHITESGLRVEHGVPDGFEFDDHGQLRPMKEA